MGNIAILHKNVIQKETFVSVQLDREIMIIKIYIVRCSFCHKFLPDPYALDQRTPQHFNSLDSIPLALEKAKWGTINGMQICKICHQQYCDSQP